MRPAKILVLGYGNPGRGDDGLGPSAAAAVEAADLLARHDVVVFIDAATEGLEPFSFRRIQPGPAVMFSTHSATPEGVLTLADELFHESPEAFVLGIRGYEFNEFREELSARARANLAAAVDFLVPLLRTGRVEAGPQSG